VKKDLIIMGAFDRYNYGDLLFPIFLIKYIELYRPDVIKNYNEIIPVALENKDFTNVGGISTLAWKELKINVSKDIIVAGGDVLGATVSGLYMDSLDSYTELLKAKIIRKYISKNHINRKAIKKFNIDNNFPYIPVPEKSNVNNIVYNSVSGSEFITGTMEEKKKNIILDRLSKSTYVSNRDSSTFEALKKQGIDVNLAPDSATIMSELFPVNTLKKLVNSEILSNTEEKEYIVFQFGYWKVRNSIEELVGQIEEISLKDNVEIVLLPVGFASNHDDLIALQKVSRKLKIKHHLYENVSIWDIMYIIGNAKFFFGTSLHGNITAMSYGIPHIGLSEKIVKLDKYLNTWSIYPFNNNIKFGDISSFYYMNKDFDNVLLKKNAKRLNELVHNNYKKLFNALML